MKEQGITLIVLVITIIILIILAGVSIFNIMDETGILDKKDDAIEKYEEKQEKIENEIQDINYKWQNIIKDTGIENSHFE